MLKKRIRLRLSDEDYKRLQALADAYKMKKTEFIRRAIRDGIDRLENSAKLRLINEIRREVHRIGVNINQIARWANTYKAKADSWQILTMLNEVEREIRNILEKLQNDC